MTYIVFWEKPGCQTNAKQRAMLTSAGHTLEVRNLLTESWSELGLLDFMLDLPVRDWFNLNSPRVKSGEVEPGRYHTTAALHAMIEDPLLIRRPLIQIGNTRMVGFDVQQLRKLIALPEHVQGITSCSSPAAPCPEP